MRRENRKKNNSNISLYITLGVLLIAIATFVITFIVYSNKLTDSYSFDSEYLAQYTNTEENKEIDVSTEMASSSIGKTVNETKDNNSVVIKNEEENTDEIDIKEKENNVAKTSVTKDPTFIKPVDGTISKEYAKDSLVYSETLKEWITHLGIDILAEKTTVVKASADGTIKYIKNDPRYGLSIIIEHTNGFQTVYANLLTTDFISEGEEVSAGQTIGTVGDSSVYEIADESHLHFEILKNEENVNPTDYINF